jgi:hypothetical protein
VCQLTWWRGRRTSTASSLRLEIRMAREPGAYAFLPGVTEKLQHYQPGNVSSASEPRRARAREAAAPRELRGRADRE